MIKNNKVTDGKKKSKLKLVVIALVVICRGPWVWQQVHGFKCVKRFECARSGRTAR